MREALLDGRGWVFQRASGAFRAGSFEKMCLDPGTRPLARGQIGILRNGPLKGSFSGQEDFEIQPFKDQWF